MEGEQLGIVPLAEALAKAEAAELDLVEIAPMAEPPVCRIMDYGKFKYRESKKQHEAKLKLKQIQVKEVKFRPGTDEGDYKIKLRNLIQFLERRRQGEDHAALPRPRDGAPGVRRAAARADQGRSRAAQRRRVVSEDGRPANGDAAGPEEGAGADEAATRQKHHHDQARGWSPSNDGTKPLPRESRAKESTTVGSK